MASTRERCKEIREQLPITHVATAWYGHELSKDGRGVCPFCDGTNPTKFRIVEGTGFLCAGCDAKGDVLSYIKRRENLKNMGEVVAFVDDKVGAELDTTPMRKNGNGRNKHLKEECRYQYTNEDGTPAYEIVRYWNESREKKELRPVKNGRFGLSKEERVIYRLHQVANVTDQTIFITEGEKCADAIASLGLVGTTNPFGCGEWKDEFNYSEHFEGRNVIIMPDADDEGEKWLKSVLDDLRGKVAEIRVLRLPKTWIKKNRKFRGHDIADYLETEGADKTLEWIKKAERNADVMVRGFDVGISASPLGLYNNYLKLMEQGVFNVIDFSLWLPSLQVKARRGDCVCFLGGTGVGKSRTLMNLMYHVNNVNYIVFDLELSGETVGERWCALHNNVSVDHVQEAFKMGHPYELPPLDHVRIVPCGSKDMGYIRERIDAEEQITGKEMHVVVVDYIGLMKGSNGSRYERMSSLVEEFKGELNDLGKAGVISSQRSRPPNKEEDLYQCPSVFDAKDSGSIENSSQLLLGFWKLKEKGMLATQVLKYSHGNCNPYPIRLTENELKIVEEINRQ